MKYVFLAILIVSIVIFIIWYLRRKRWAIFKVKCTNDREKLMYINKALEPFGFAFDLNCDIVVSQNDGWQRDLGFTDLYDLHAPLFNMVMEAQPLYFEYDDKQYRIELWKGQYGITTGSEIGIYIHDEGCPKGFYRSANDKERLNMRFLLNKNCDLFTRCDNTWWLAGFDIGTFSRPKDLKMTICIELSNCEMRNAFIKSLIESGYSLCQLNICNNTVCFEYCHPSNYKPNHKHCLIKYFAQILNYINCHIYLFFTRFFNRTIDRLTYLRFMAPSLYRLIIRLSVPRRKQHKKLLRKKNRKTKHIRNI